MEEGAHGEEQFALFCNKNQATLPGMRGWSKPSLFECKEIAICHWNWLGQCCSRETEVLEMSRGNIYLLQLIGGSRTMGINCHSILCVAYGIFVRGRGAG